MAGKLDIIRDHVTTAIQMIAMECSPYSTHVIVMSGEELIQAMADHRGVTLDADWRNIVHEAHKKEYRAKVRSVYNYCKHADRDANDPIPSPTIDDLRLVNEGQTILNINGLRNLGLPLSEHFISFLLLMSIKHPKYFSMDTLLANHPLLHREYTELQADTTITAEVLRTVLRRSGHLPASN